MKQSTYKNNNLSGSAPAINIDEHREDFIPTFWQPGPGMDIKQVWFCGAHADIGGSYQLDENGHVLSDNSLEWMITGAQKAGLVIENHLSANVIKSPLAKLHNSRRSFYWVKKKVFRKIDHGQSEVLIHKSVKTRWDQDAAYRPENLAAYIEKNGWPD